MEKFCQHIEKLLAQHDYVVVPNLGGFVIQTQSAVIHADRITPPITTIGFNPLMHHADGLLAIEIARAEALSYRASMEYIEKKVEQIKVELNQLGTLQIGHLGTLKQEDADGLFFVPSGRADFLPHNFEMVELYMSPRVTRVESERKRISFSLPSTRGYRYAAAAMLVFGLMFVTPKLNDARLQSRASVVSFDMNKMSQPVSVTPSTDSVVITNAKTDDTPQTQYFHVVVATLSTPEAAETVCDGLRDDDYTGAHVIVSGKVARVVLQTFTDRDKAVLYMENLRKIDSRFSTAWVSCR